MGIDTEGRFQVLETLAETGAGVEYRALAAGGGEVALLVVPAGGDEAVLRSRHAFRTHQRLAHPGLRQVYDYGLLPDGSPYVTLEPLRPLPATLPADQLLAALPALAQALGQLHAEGFVHGDLRPEALGLAADGAIKLRGLGTLRRAGELAPPTARPFAAPEALRGAALDQRADVFSLGAALYALVAGTPPFVGTGAEALLRAHATQPPAPLAPEPIMRMIAVDPLARPQSMAEALGEAAGLEPSLLTSRFAGREDLLTAFTRAARGPEDGLRWVVGPAGSGKTRFLAECRVAAQLEGVPFFAGQADRHGRPYGAMASLADALLAEAPQLLEGLTTEQRAALGRLLPHVATPVEQSGMEPRDERVAVQSAIAELIYRAAGPRGAVLALDDWDLADAGSRETLAYLRRNARGVPFFVLLTAAQSDAPEAWRLEPLDVQGVTELAASVLGGVSLPEEFPAALLRWSGGQPGVVLHALEHLVRSGALRGGRLPEGIPLEQLGDELQATLRAPLAGLRGAAVQAAEALAVAGADADLALLAALTGLEEEALFSALYELQARHVVLLRGDRPAFASLALEERVYGGVDPARRMALHAAVADQLELRLRARSADAASQTALARHFLRSRQLDRALSAAFLAADFNMDVFAVDVADRLLRDGLALMDEQPDQHDHWRCAFLGRLAMVQRWRGDFMAMGSCLDQAIPLAERLRENETLCKLLVMQGAYYNQQLTGASFRSAVDVLQRATQIMASGSLVTQTRCRFYLGQANFYLGRNEEASASFEEAVRLAKRANLAFWEARSLAFVGYLGSIGGRKGREAGFAKLDAAAEIQARLGDRYGAAFTAALQGEGLAKAMRLAAAEAAYQAQVATNEELEVVEDLVAGLTNLAHVRALAGRFEDALATCRQAVALAARTDQPVGQLARALEGWITACQGNLGQAEALLAACDETGGYMFTHSAPVLLAGWLRLGRLEEVRRLGQEALFALRASPDADLQAQIWALLGEAHVRLGELGTGGDYAARAWEVADREDYPLARYLALRTRTSLAMARGEADAALAAAEEGLALARAAGAQVFAEESEGLVARARLAGQLAEARAPRLVGDVLPALMLRLTGLQTLAEVAHAVARATLDLTDAPCAGVWVDGQWVAWAGRGEPLSSGSGAPLVAGGEHFGFLYAEGADAGPLALHVGLAIAYARLLAR